MTTVPTESDDRVLVIGFDLGHGETAVATLWMDEGGDPTVAELPGPGRNMHPTAVALCTDGRGQDPFTIVGASCFSVDRERIVNVDGRKELYLAFKSPSLGKESSARRAIDLFVSRIVRDLTEGGAETGPKKTLPWIPGGTSTRWVFGVPSGWTSSDCQAYQNLLTDIVTKLCPGQEVEVIPESRAALLYGQRSKDLDSDERAVVRSAAGKKTVLVIDMGSSTTDYTFVSELHEGPVDDGHTQLGAALIEQELMRWTIDHHRDSNLLKATIEKDESQREYLQFACRQAKERFFELAPEDIRLNPKPRVLGHADISSDNGEPIYVPVRVSPKLMGEILDTPLVELKDKQSNNMSWRGAFSAELSKVRDEVLHKSGRLPDVVLLTGGASRMGFAQEVCRAIFSASEDGSAGSRVLRGQEPEYAIAKGLAIAGQTRHRIEAFLSDVDVFIRNDLLQLIRENVDPLAQALATVMISGIIEDQVCPAVKKWRQGDIRLLPGIGQAAMEAREYYVKHGAGRVQAQKVVDDWYEEIAALINSETEKLANNRGIPAKELSISPLHTMRTKPDVRPNVRATLDTLDVIANISATMMSLVAAGAGLAVVAKVTAGAAAVGTAAAAGTVAASNPAGWIIGAIVGTVAVVIGIWVGKEELMERVEGADIPVFLRKIGGEQTLLNKIKKNAKADQLEAQAIAKFAEEFKHQHGEAVVTALADSIGPQLHAAAKQAALLIDRRTD